MRASPRRARSCAGSAVMSAPSKTIRPRVGPRAGRRAARPAWSCRRRSGRSARAPRRRATCEVDAVGRDDAAEALRRARARRAASSAGTAGSSRQHRATPRRARPTRPWRANSTTASSTQPVQNSQCVGVGRRALPPGSEQHRGAEHAAPEPADAAEDHHDHQRARLRPVQHVRADVALLVARAARRRGRRARRR